MKRVIQLAGAAVIALVMMLPLVGRAESVVVEEPPLQSRKMQWVKAGSFRFPVDVAPKWVYERLWPDNESNSFVAETPALYYPPATFNAQHFYQQYAPKSQRDAKFFFRGILESAAKNYGYAETVLPDIQETKKGRLKGYQIKFPGQINNIEQDVVMFAAVAPDKSVFVLTAFTLPDKADHLQNTFDRVAINIDFVEKKIETYRK